MGDSVYKTIINPRMSTRESHAKSYEEICLHFEWIIPKSILFSFEQGMNLLRLWKVPPLFGFSQTMGAEERQVYIYSKTDVCSYSKTDVI